MLRKRILYVVVAVVFIGITAIAISKINNSRNQKVDKTDEVKTTLGTDDTPTDTEMEQKKEEKKLSADDFFILDGGLVNGKSSPVEVQNHSEGVTFSGYGSMDFTKFSAIGGVYKYKVNARDFEIKLSLDGIPLHSPETDPWFAISLLDTKNGVLLSGNGYYFLMRPLESKLSLEFFNQSIEGGIKKLGEKTFEISYADEPINFKFRTNTDNTWTLEINGQEWSGDGLNKEALPSGLGYMGLASQSSDKEKLLTFTVYSIKTELSSIELSDNEVGVVDDKEISLRGNIYVKAGQFYNYTANTPKFNGAFNYYIFDWGNGEMTPVGVYKAGVSGTVSYTWPKEGEYQVRAMAVNIDGGVSTGWSSPMTVNVVGVDQSKTEIRPVRAISSGEYGSNYKSSNVIDNKKDTAWRSEGSNFRRQTNWIGLEFNDIYRVNEFHVTTVEGSKAFPGEFLVQYTIDKGQTWHTIPKYDFGKEGPGVNYSRKVRFPTPMGNTIVFNLGGINANAVRVVSKEFDTKISDEYYFEVSQLKAFGDKEYLFSTSEDKMYNAALNNMWTVFGNAKNEVYTTGNSWVDSANPYKGGVIAYGVTEWLEWSSLKLTWYNDMVERNRLLSDILNVVIGRDGQGNEGYVWAGQNGPKHLGLHYKYTYNQMFIIAARNYALGCENNREFFDKKDSRGNVLIDKLRTAMNYMLEVHNGKNGIFIISDPEHDGTYKGGPSNYWDNLTSFGYKSAYENIFFYASLNAMADIEEIYGNLDKAKVHRELAVKVKDNYNRYFWDDQKGRYIASIDINGNKNDYGFTFVNVKTVEYGLATSERTKAIYAWLDGERIIEGETSTGKDIYFWGFAPRANTIAIESIKPYAWYDMGGKINITPSGNAVYGTHLENGGAIFYVSYYDIMGRIKGVSPENGLKRLNGIMGEFYKDELRRLTVNSKGADWVEGIVGPFPESGLVPLVYINGFMGIRPTVEGLKISPQLPPSWDYASIREYYYNGFLYEITVVKDADKKNIEKMQDGKIKIVVPSNSEVLVQGSIFK